MKAGQILRPSIESAVEHLDNAIGRLEGDIETYQASLESEAQWLFLTVLGCVGAPPPLRIPALMIALWLFGRRVVGNPSVRHTFPARIRRLDLAIADAPLEDGMRSRYRERVETIRTVRLPTWRMLRRMPAFVVCHGTLCAALLYEIAQLGVMK
jgi:hypothetical protein